VNVLTLLIALAAQPPPAVRAREVLDLLLAGKADELYALFDERMQKALPRDVVIQQVTPQFRSLGAPQHIGEPRTQTLDHLTVVLIPVKFPAASIQLQVSVDAEGRVAGLFFRPGETPPVNWRPPPYAKPGAFREREVTVGSADGKLPGTLTVPAGKGPFPAMVLVHGSGPQDRDETVGQNKIFRDLAEGLASRGIAVLRYDKRTKVYAEKMASMREFTVREETIDDALSAAALLRQTPEIDSRRIFLLGHSLGGYLAPRIAKADPRLAGLIILAGNTRPLEDLILEQVEYLASLKDPGAQSQCDRIRQSVAEIKKVRAGAQPPSAILGMPAAYMLDLIRYDPVAEARQLSIPMLILQGERDYQVTMKDFEGWKAALGHRKDVALKAYPALNHLFIAGSGKSKPSEYQTPGHVAEEVVEDIAQWVHAISK